jgi:N-acetylglucosaminyl-diphospho-decaprenol L-rhamnosyltransferase
MSWSPAVMSDPATPRLSIVIVAYNSRAHIDRCLESLVGRPPKPPHDIVVVDNASPDGTAAAVRDRWTGVRVIDAGGNLGFARANNLGIQQTAGELVLLLNPDTSVPAGAIDRLVEALDARPDAAVAGPRLVDGDGRTELSFGAMISPLAELRQKLLVFGNERRLWPISTYVERISRRARDVDWVSGACMLLRRSDATAAGFMDERYFMYAEDVDFCAAVRVRQRRVLFVPSAEVVHLRGRSRATAPAEVERAYRLSQIAFYEKHHPLWARPLRWYLKLKGRLPDISNAP